MSSSYDAEHAARDIWGHLNAADWSESEFTVQKAYVSAIFSGLTYLSIPKYEIAGSNRFKIVPCHAYRRLASIGESRDVLQLLSELDFENSFLVSRRYAIVLCVITNKAVFIAIRGTQFAYDWLINARASRVPHAGQAGTAHFHRGFFRAITACLAEVSRELVSRVGSFEEPLPIYLTGHSLGGAMAAIMNALWALRTGGEWTSEGQIYPHRISATSCYTFGMPRYGDAVAVSSYRTPYQVYSDGDIIPSVPPRWLGYDDAVDQYRVDGVALESVERRQYMSFLKWIASLATGRGIADHSIELYQERLRANFP